MRQKTRFCKRWFAVLLALAMVFTTVDVQSLAVQAADNAYEATSDTHGATYDAASKQVTFWVSSDDAFYGQTDFMWYKEYTSYDAAVADHVKNGGNFIAGVGATNLTESNGKKTATASVADDTQAILYYFNAGAGHDRTQYEHIVEIKNGTGSASGNDPVPSQPVTSSTVNLETADTYWFAGSQEGWGAAAATLTRAGTKATIEATNFGTESSEWQMQYMVKEIGVDANKTYKLEFDITSSINKKVFVKLDDENALITDTISLSAGQTMHYSKNQKAGNFSAKPYLIFGLGQFAGEDQNLAGTITIENVKLTEVTLEPDTKPELPEGASYIDFDLVEHSDYTEGVNVNVDYAGTTATVTGTDWGNDWGGDSKWQIQLKSLIPVTAGQEYTFSFKIKSEVARSIFVKLGNLDNDNSVFYNDTISLDAGVEKVVTGTTSAVDVENLMFLLALGDQTASTQNTITVSDLAIYSKATGYINTMPYINFEKLDHAADFSQDVDVTINYSGTTINVAGSDWGNDWGGDSKWQIQLKEPIPVTANDTYDFSFKVKSDIARNLYIKLGDLNNDEAVFYENTIALEAGVEKVVTGTTTAVDIEQLMFLFALGDQNGTTANTMTISNLLLKGAKSGYVKVKESSGTPAATGKEYDFTTTEDNTANDYADPGVVKEGYELIWADEFDGNYGDATVDADTGLNLDNWAYQLGDGTTDCSNPGWGNNELQSYTGNKKNIGVNEDLTGDGEGNGVLRITASYEPGYVYESEGAKNYTSARIRTTKPDETLFTTTYGYVEARISLPETQGAWPAFWMLPESTSIYGGWPLSGELDIMETTGLNTNKACGTLHWGAPDHVYKGSGYVELNSEIAYFHTYAVDWQPNSITWYYDGKPIYTSTSWESGVSSASDKTSFDAPFDQPFYMLLNLAVDSGQFGGAANKANFQNDINMYVDYVRVYQKEDGYPAYAEKTASSSAATDWDKYAGQNQIAELTASNVVNSMAEGGMDDKTSDLGKWYFSYQTDASDATVATVTENGTDWAKIGINTPGSKDYSVQLIGHYNAKCGYVYKVSFDAYADGGMVGKTVNCDSKEWSGWSANGIQSFELKSTPTKVSYVFEQKEDFDKCRIEFNLGAAGSGNVYVGNVKVEIVDPAMLSGGSDSGSRAVLSDGNVIYNGTFDQGSKHVGYWSAAEGTTLEVPRYTTTKIADDDVSVIDVASKTNYEKVADGVKYYERRAQISAADAVHPVIYQNGFSMKADEYTLSFDMYSKADTTVTVGIFSTDEDGNLQDQIKASSVAYKAADGLKTLGFKLNLTEDVEHAALVLKFDKGASVQIDNVSLAGASQGIYVDPTPVTSDATWTGDNGNGQSISLDKNGDVYTMNNVTSGANWYSPQIGSQNFQLVAGKQYDLSFKYKMTGTSNNRFDYIIQENGGGWKVYNGGPTEVHYDAEEADADGFCTYTVRFTADATLNTVHLNFGLGNSQANGDASFSFKDVKLTLVETGGGSTEGGNTDQWEDVKDDILDGTGVKPNPTPDPDPTPDPKPAPDPEPAPNPATAQKPSNSGNSASNAGGQTIAKTEVKADWDHLLKRVEDAKQLLIGHGGTSREATVNAVVGRDMKVSQKLADALKAEKIILALHTGDGLAISIEGDKLDKNTVAMDLSLSSENHKIPEALIAEKTAKAYAQKLVTFNKNEQLPNGLNMHFRFGSENTGRQANLYRYDEQTGKLIYEGSFKITDKGAAMFALKQTASYLVTVTDEIPVGDGFQYQVVSGDTLSRLSVRFGVKLPQLLKWNPQITNPDMIRTGQIISVSTR